MSHALSIVAAADLDAETCDAAPGIEAPEVPAVRPGTTIFVAIGLNDESGDRPLWSLSREMLRSYLRKNRYGHAAILSLVPDRQVTSGDAISVRELPLSHLMRDNSLRGRLGSAGCRTLGSVADLGWKDYFRAGLKPADWRIIKRSLAKFGLKPSFEPTEGEVRGWSPKRRSA